MRRLLNRASEAISLHRHVKDLRLAKMTRLLIEPSPLTLETIPSSLSLSEKMIERIIKSYQNAPREGEQSPIWSGLTTANKAFIQALDSGDRETVARYLNDLFQTELTSGMAHIVLPSSARKQRQRHRYFMLRFRDVVLCLGEALGVKSLLSHHQSSFQDFRSEGSSDLLPLIEAIEDKLGHSISVPSFGRPFGFRLGERFFNIDSIRHAYVMYRARQLGFQPHHKIVEIGGGFGNVARYANLNGFRNYTIVDLPHINVVQAAFLAATLGEENVRLYGEENNAPISLAPNTAADESTFDCNLVINMDSLPEIGNDEAKNYIRLIRDNAEYFLSINQEAAKAEKGHDFVQNTVRHLTTEIGRLKCLHRHLSWVEQGYVEEFFQIGEKPPHL